MDINPLSNGGTIDHNSLPSKEEIRDHLRIGVLEVKFTKSDGTVREMNCTLAPHYLPVYEGTDNPQPKRKKDPNSDSISVWDIDKNGWRSFKLSSIIEWKKL